MERERRLVTMVTVRDQELQVGDIGDFVDAPEAISSRLEVRCAVGHPSGRAVVEEEDRLELRPRRTQQPQPPFLRPRVRPLVREDRAGPVRLEPERHDDAVARPLDAVRADVALGERPGRRLLRDEHAGFTPVREVARGLLLRVRQRQVHDVVRAAREVLGALVLRDHVVGRRNQVLERARDGRVVALRAKGTNLGHGCTVP